MTHKFFLTRTILVTSLMLFPLILPVGTFGAEPLEGTLALQNEGLKQIAAGSAQDSLKACLARIPENATVGQLLLAEQNCQHVEKIRTESNYLF